jgi:hypothetical protein
MTTLMIQSCSAGMKLTELAENYQVANLRNEDNVQSAFISTTNMLTGCRRSVH